MGWFSTDPFRKQLIRTEGVLRGSENRFEWISAKQ